MLGLQFFLLLVGFLCRCVEIPDGVDATRAIAKIIRLFNN